eukprot:scaffold7352_cov254-Pinguiococcus_pyrenoidosus.AAC.41
MDTYAASKSPGDRSTYSSKKHRKRSSSRKSSKRTERLGADSWASSAALRAETAPSLSAAPPVSEGRGQVADLSAQTAPAVAVDVPAQRQQPVDDYEDDFEAYDDDFEDDEDDSSQRKAPVQQPSSDVQAVQQATRAENEEVRFAHGLYYKPKCWRKCGDRSGGDSRC